MEGGDPVSGVDNRIVTMKFDNRQFESGAQTSMNTLSKLKQSMDFGKIVGGTVRGLGTVSSALSKIGLKTPFAPMIEGANKGLSLLGGAFDRLGMKNPFGTSTQGAQQLNQSAQQASGGMGILQGGVTAVSGKFLALTTVALTALSQITSKAVNAGLQFAKSFTFGPIMQGLDEYQTNLKSIQTVQANTDQPLDKVNASLEELNKYSDQTIYNFSEMARNVGTFTAAGVDLETSVSSIKGIANLAALSGSSSEQAATAMYQLSQAIASGKVGLMDWNSVVNAGMGGKKLQNALAQTGVAMGVLTKNAVKLNEKTGQLTINNNSFRESIMAKPGESSWLTSDILVNTLSTMDGRFSAAALAAEKTETGLRKYSKAQIEAKIATARHNLEVKNGVKFTDEQFKELQKMSTAAFKSATEVKTLGQVFDILKETMGSGWSASFKNIFGDLEQAKKSFTAMKDALSKPIEDAALHRNKILEKWNRLGGRDSAIDGIRNAWEAILKILGPIHDGFRDIFPAQTITSLMEMTTAFERFTENLIPSKATMADLRDISSGVFSVLGIGKLIIVGLYEGLKTLFATVGGGQGDFLDFAANVGRSITAFHDFLAESGLVTGFFRLLGTILSVPLSLLKAVARAIGSLFDGFDDSTADKMSENVDRFNDKVAGVQTGAEKLKSFFSNLSGFFRNIGEHIGNAILAIGDAIAGAIGPDTFDKSLDMINTALFGGLILLVRKFFNNGIDVTGGFFDSIKGTLDATTGALNRMQAKLNADILLRIAGAIGIMALSLALLATIDGGKLTKALVAMGAGLGAMTFAMNKMAEIIGVVGAAKLPLIAAGFLLISVGLIAMATALKIMASIEFADMLRGMLGFAGMFYILHKAMKPMLANAGGFFKVAAGLVVLGVALNLMALALKTFATMSWEELIKGLAGMAGTLLVLAGALKIMPDMKAEGIGLVLLGVALNLMAVAMKVFATMSWEDMAKGLVAIAGALGIISVAVNTMPKTMMLQAAALVVVAGALVVLSGALKVMGSMSWGEVAKGLVMLAGSLLILGVGLQVIGVVGAVGAVGLMLAAAALAVFAPVMLSFGAMDWMSILKSLTMLAGIFVVLGVAGALLAPVVPVILGLGLALLLMGAGIALVGVGALALATAIGILVAVGSAGVQLLVKAMWEVIKVIPHMMTAFGKGLVNMVVAIAKKGPELTRAFSKILGNMLDAVIRNGPKIERAIDSMLSVLEHIIVKAWPRWIQLGAEFIIKLLQGLTRNMPRISRAGTDTIISFMRATGKQMPRIVDAGYKMIIDFLNGIANAIRNNSEQMGRAGANIGMAIIEGTVKGLSGAGDAIEDKLVELGRQAWEGVKNFFGIKSPSKLMEDTFYYVPLGAARGVDKAAPELENSMHKMGKSAMAKMQETMQGLDDALALDPNLNPTVTPVLDLGQLTREANKMSDILATAPIMPGVSYQTAAAISAMTQPPPEGEGGPDDGSGGGGDTYVNLEHHIHAPGPVDSTKVWRGDKSLISLAKEALK
jgi:tape measure domain-containing protein